MTLSDREKLILKIVLNPINKTNLGISEEILMKAEVNMIDEFRQKFTPSVSIFELHHMVGDIDEFRKILNEINVYDFNHITDLVVKDMKKNNEGIDTKLIDEFEKIMKDIVNAAGKKIRESTREKEFEK